MTDESSRFASDDLRKVIGDGPPYDAQKVLTWFNQKAEVLLIELEELEEHWRKYPSRGIQAAKQHKDLLPLQNQLTSIMKPIYQQYLAETGCDDCAANKTALDVNAIVGSAVYACNPTNQKFCPRHTIPDE